MAAYPTLAEVNAADRVQLAKWVRFLKSPGVAAVQKMKPGDLLNTVADEIDSELFIMARITGRFQELGGMSPEISKQIGWRP